MISGYNLAVSVYLPLASSSSDSGTVEGHPLALLTIAMLPLTLPAAVGPNWTLGASFCHREGVTSPLPPVNEEPDPFKGICEMDTLAGGDGS